MIPNLRQKLRKEKTIPGGERRKNGFGKSMEIEFSDRAIPRCTSIGENAERFVEWAKREVALRLYTFKPQANQIFYIQWC